MALIERGNILDYELDRLQTDIYLSLSAIFLRNEYISISFFVFMFIFRTDKKKKRKG